MPLVEEYLTLSHYQIIFSKARDEAHQCIRKLNWDGGFYRRDIGYKVID